MKHSIILLTLACMALLCQAQNRIDKQGLRQGHWIKTDKDGSRIFEGDFVDGKEVGVFNYYYADGKLKMRNTFTTPGRYCRHEAFDREGHLLATGYYNQKNRDSVWHYFNEQGHLIKIASYRMGIKQGPHIIFDAKGDTAEVATWRDNHRHGRWWKRLGEKAYITGRYENGLMQGRLTEYDNSGRLRNDCNYLDGARHGQSLTYEGGILTVKEKWQKGTLEERQVLLHTPQPRWQSIYHIAYIVPKSMGTIVYLSDSTRLNCNEDFETLNQRIGDELFVILDRKNRVVANKNSIGGLTQDREGRTIVDLWPVPPFTIFPDEDCIKMIRSLKRIDELDE